MESHPTFQNRGKAVGALSAILLAGLFAAMAHAKPAPKAVPAPLDIGDVVRGAHQFDNIYQNGGMSGAQTYSRACHKKAGKTRDWSRRDFCAAFDIAADIVDEGMATRARFPRDEYFASIVEDGASRYRRLSADTVLLEARLRSIRDAVGPALLAAVEARSGND